MTFIFFVLSFLGIILNLYTGCKMSNASAWMMLAEHFALLFFGYIVIRRVLHRYSSKQRNYFYGCFLLSYSLTLFFLWWSWTPFILPSSPGWGFDPQRYYLYAYETVVYGSSSFGLNYDGIVSLYVFIFHFFGVDPLVPVFINTAISIVSCSLLARVLGEYMPDKTYRFAWLLFIPEIIYYNMMPSRETICGFCVALALYEFIMLTRSKSVSNVLLFIFAVGLCAFIRPPFAGALIASVGVYLLFFSRSISMIQKFFLLVGIVALLSFSLSLYQDLQLGEKVEQALEGNVNASEDFNYAENSIALKLIPNNPVQFFVYGIVRSFLYLIPSPNFFSAFSAKSEHAFWQYVSRELTTIFMFLTFSSLIGFLRIVKNRLKADSILLCALGLICFFFIIGMFNTNMVHHRYRIVYDYLYFGLFILALNILPRWKLRQMFSNVFWIAFAGLALVIVLKFAF